MVSVREHYEDHLASYYAWISGGIETNLDENRKFFSKHDIKPIDTGRAIDLGAGCGFQSIPLAESGFRVFAIDLSANLLKELKVNAPHLPIETICDDLSNLDNYISGNIDLVVCMGDTLTHLPALNRVEVLLRQAYSALVPGGRLILSFRDLSQTLTGLDRFIPVRSDESTIFTCFLEYEKSTVTVNDIIYEKKKGRWNLRKSAYQKLRIHPDWTRDYLQNSGFTIAFYEEKMGLIFIIAEK